MTAREVIPLSRRGGRKNAAGGSPRPRRRRLALGVGLVAVVLAAGMGITGAMALPTVTVIEVDNIADKIDTSPGDGQCIGQGLEGSGYECSLRAAIQEANALAGVQTLQIVPGTYSLGIVPLNENASNVGDLEILDPVTIERHPDYDLASELVVIDGGNPPPSYPLIARGIDRLFEIHPGAGDVTFRDVVLQNGWSPEEGGAIMNWSFGKLTLERVTVLDNYAEGGGGGLQHGDVHDYPWTTEPPNLDLLPHGRVEIKASTFTGNGSGGTGAAINNVSGGTITISDGSQITLNPGAIMPDPLEPEGVVLVDPSDYPIGPSAIEQEAAWDGVGTLKITGSTVSRNAAEGNGGGIASAGDSIVVLDDATIADNYTEASGGGLYTEGGDVKVLASRILRNEAANGGGLYSGGAPTLYGLRGRFEVKDSLIQGNSAENGGGIMNDGEAQLFVSDTELTKNHSADHGAAIASEGRANLTLTRVDVVDNESWGEGGGVWTASERLQLIQDSTIEDNDAGVPHIEDGMLTDDVAGGGGLYTDGGPVTVLRTTFHGNTATEEGGGLSIHNLGDFVLRDSTVEYNRAADGGGLENSAHRVTFERVLVFRNHSDAFGGGIYNTSSGEFKLLDSTIRENSGVAGGGLANAPDNHIVVRGSLFLNNSARSAPLAEGELDVDENAGRGGGLLSIADGQSLYENTTFSGNKAAVAGGGLFHDADGELRLTHATVWRNSAPVAGGVGVMESDFSPPIPPKTNAAVIVKNSIIGGSVKGGNCDWFIRSEGGNLETGAKNTCFLAVTAATAQSPIELGVRDRRGDPQLWAIADNGGPTMTHALQYGSLAIDSSAKPCSIVDQRAIARPQNGRCDSGAFEFVGLPPAADDVEPETYFTHSPSNPKQDSVETMAFTFSGSDNMTAANELNFQCRLIEVDLVEQPEIIPPWEPVPPELQWNGCSSPWSVPLAEEGMFIFEVRAIDRLDNMDSSPISELLPAVGLVPPETVLLERPPLQTNNRSALFSFRADSEFTPTQFAEFECRLDSRDPAMWLECTNPAMYSNLTTGLHTFEVRAWGTEGGGPDPTPATYTWRIGPDPNATSQTPLDCDQANITLTPRADAWADQVNPLEGYQLMTELNVRSAATEAPGEPTNHQNARSFFRFDTPESRLGADGLHCTLESATLRLWAEGGTEGRTLLAVPLAETWKESTLTWLNQPDLNTGATPSATDSNSGGAYVEWDVTQHVNLMRQPSGGIPSNGWAIVDGFESDALEGGEQSFLSREMPQDPPPNTLPELVLRYVAAGTPPPAPPPEPPAGPGTVVECGAVITVSTKLAADVTGCLGEGIAIGAPNIVLDLNGKTISSGLLLEPGEEDGLTPGIRSGYKNVVIRGPGVVTNFGYGVLLGPGATYNVVEGLTLTRNILAGVTLFDADDGRNGNTIRDNAVDANGETGIQLLAGTEGSVIENNTFTQNGMSIHLDESSNNRIEGNEISGIILDPLLDSDAGIVLENGSKGNTLVDNDVSDTGDAGIIIQTGSHKNSVTGGILVRNGDAGVIVGDSNEITIDGVLAHQQSDGGVVLGNSHRSTVKNSDLRFNPSGVDASSTNNLIVENNDVSNSLQAGIELGNGLAMRILNNTANQSGGSGISIEGGTFGADGAAVDGAGALISGNEANQNAENGIGVSVAKHTLDNNSAHNNAGFGILAGEEQVAGEPLDPNANIDGGGNEASGNGEVVDCIGVVCANTGPVPLLPLDTTPPETTITDGPLGVPAPAAGSTGSEIAVFEFTATDNTSPITAMSFECRLDAPADVVEPVDPELEPPDGPVEPPEPPESEWWAECVSPFTIQGLEPGDHTFEVRATDHSFNTDFTPAVYEWTITSGVEEDGSDECGPTGILHFNCAFGSIRPETTITAAPGEWAPDALPAPRFQTTNNAATFRFLGSDNLTSGYNIRYECRRHWDEWDTNLTPAEMPDEIALPFVSCDSPHLYSALPDGGHIFEVRAKDLANNVDMTPAWHSWWIYPPPPDLTPPDTEILSGPDATTIDTNPRFTFAGTDNRTATGDLTFECKVFAPASAATDWEPCTSPHTEPLSSPAGLTEFVFQVRAIDAAGNLDDVNGTTTDALEDGVPAAWVWQINKAAIPKTVFCGQVITESVKLNNSLGDCVGHGLIVGANNITIDLNGKTIDGKSVGAGVMNNGFDSVTIKSGTLTDFDYGVMLNFGTKTNIVHGVTAHLNQDAGVGLGQPTAPNDPSLTPSDPPPGTLSQVTDNIVRSSTLVSNARGAWIVNGSKDNTFQGNLIGATSGEAVLIDRSSENVIDGNDIEVASKAGVLLEGAVDNVIRDNTIAEVGGGVIIRATTTGTTGIQSSGNVADGNAVTDSAGPAFEIEDSYDNQLVDNTGTLVDSYAIELYLADDNLIEGNDVSGNKGGIDLKNSAGNVIEGNNASESDSTGITLQSQSFTNVLRENESSDNGGSGIYIGDETPAGQGTLVEGNVTNSNTGMGIQATKPAHVFRNNAAFDNDSWGINVSDPSNGRANVDGGGNVAQGNKGPLGVDLKPQQCYNISCLAGPPTGDQIAPDTSILEGPDTTFAPSPDDVAVLRFTGADNASPVTFECKLGTGAWETCASPKSYTGLVDGEYTFQVRATDMSGNVDPSPATWEWEVELGEFQVTIDSAPDPTTVQTAASFDFSSARGNGTITYQCAIATGTAPPDLGTAGPCTSPARFGVAPSAGLAPGTYTFGVRATDSMSFYDESFYTWTIGPPPVPTEVFCGQILTQSTLVTNDLIDCGGFGLMVGADDITIDLDGHTIDGMGLDAGIFNPQYDNVTITNGFVMQFLHGVQLNAGVSGNIVSDLRLEQNAEAGIALSDADENGIGNTIRDNSLIGNELGIALFTGTQHTLIRGNSLAANGGEGAIYMEFSSQNRVESNQIVGSGGASVFIAGGGSNTILENTIKNSGGGAIVAGNDLLGSNENLIQRNTISGGQGGVLLSGNDNDVINNTIGGTLGPAIALELANNNLVQGNELGGSASGIVLAVANSNDVLQNNASGTGGSGIEVGEFSLNNDIVDNTASGNGGDGIAITETSVQGLGNLVDGNRTDANGGDGIYVEGATHEIRDNVAQMNGGWGIYAVGSHDGGGNTAAGNMEPDQCFGVECDLLEVPGAPDTEVLSGPVDTNLGLPGIQSNSRNASFTYIGTDGPDTDLTTLVFECRLDSQNALAWEDCEYPAEYLNLSPGLHRFEVRAVDMLGQGLADPTPAFFEWEYVPMDAGVAPAVTIGHAPLDVDGNPLNGVQTWLLESIFTFTANEPDVTFQCRVDTSGWQPCGFEGATHMSQGAFEWALTEAEVGDHTFYVRAIDFEGNVGEPTTFDWTLLGITVTFTDGPGFTPATGSPADGTPATGGPTSETSAEIFFEANVMEGTEFWCRFDTLDPGEYFPCESPFQAGPEFGLAPGNPFPEPLLAGDHMLEVFAENPDFGSAAELEPAVYEWEVVNPADTLPPDTTIELMPGDSLNPLDLRDSSATTFEFIGVDDLTPPFLLTFECQLTLGTALPSQDLWVPCFSPFNLLDAYTYEDPLMANVRKTFWVRAVDMAEFEFPTPPQTQLEGNPDPTPASYTWTPTADVTPPTVSLTGGPADGAVVAEVAPYTFTGQDNATPLLGPLGGLEFQCVAIEAPLTVGSIGWAQAPTCESPHEFSGLDPGTYTVVIRAVDRADNASTPATRALTVAAAPIVTILSGAAGHIDPDTGQVALPLHASEAATFTFGADQPGSTFACSLDGADFTPCTTETSPGVFAETVFVETSGDYTFAVRATNAQGIVGEEVTYEFRVELGPDTTRPSTRIVSGPANGMIGETATFTFTGADNRTQPASLRFECAFDSTTSWSSCTSPLTLEQLSRGTHTLRVRAIDLVNLADNVENVCAVPATGPFTGSGSCDAYTWFVTAPPTAVILTGPGVEVETTTSRTATFTFSSDIDGEAGTVYHCWFDGELVPEPADPLVPEPCTSPITFDDLGLGPHLFAVRAVDSFGNLGLWEDVEFTVTPPVATIVSGPASGTTTDATFTFTSAPFDADAAFYCSLDGRPFGTCTSPKSYSNLWPGLHTFQVQTVYTGLDWTGQPLEFEPVPATHTWTVEDHTPPETYIDFGPSGTTIATSAYIGVSSDDPTATIVCTLNAAPADCEPGVVTELTDLLPGSFTFTAQATDPSGNVDATPASRSWTIEAPTGTPNTGVGANVAVALPQPGGTGTATITFASVETAGFTVLQQLGGGPSLPEGYGGASSMIYDISTTALFTEPVTVCLTYDPDAFATTSVRLLHFDGETWIDITTLNNPFDPPAKVCGLAESFSLFAVAAASSGMLPETSILSGPAGPLNADGIPTSTSGSATFRFWADQPDAITQCSLDGDPWFYCESPLTVGPLAAGDHEFLVQAISLLGWVDVTPAIFEWEVIGPDVTAPTTLITGGPANGSETPNFINTFTFSGTDDFSPALELDYECFLNGATLGNCETPEEIEVTAPGVYTLNVRAIDEAGNMDPVGASRTWRVLDISAPDTEIILGPDQETTETSATFEFEGFELLDGSPVTTFECALDSGTFQACTSPHEIAGPLSAGLHVFHVRAVDVDGNRDISPDFYEWLVVTPPDTTPPDTFIELGPDQPNSGPDVIFAFSSSEPAEFECVWGNVTPTSPVPASAPATGWTDCGAVLVLESLGSGQHWLFVRAIDLAEIPNVDPTPAGPYVWTTTGEPDTTILTGPPLETDASTATFTFQSGQAGATFQCSVDGLPFVNCSSPFQTGGFVPGESGEPIEHTFEVRAVNQYVTADGAQVMDLTPALYEWSVQDVTPPETQFLSAVPIGPPDFLEPGLRFTFRGDDLLASSFELTFECMLDNTLVAGDETWEGCGEMWIGDSFMYEIAYADLTLGPYRFHVRALDVVENTDQTPAPEDGYAFTVEEEPDTTIDTVTDPNPLIGTIDPLTGELLTDSTSITFTFSSATPNVTFLCQLSTSSLALEPYAECTSPVTRTVPYGTHAFRVMAVGQFGTPDPEPAEFTWQSGYLTAPDVTIDTFPADADLVTAGVQAASADAAFTFSSSDPLALFNCQLDNEPIQRCDEGTVTYSGLRAGDQNPHTLTVTAEKPNLLVDGTIATFEWTIIDAAAPDTLFTQTPPAFTGNAVEFRFTGVDNGTAATELTFECSLDGTPFEACSSPLSLTELAGGMRTLQVRATDLVPLTDDTPASYTWQVVAPPATQILTFPTDPSESAEATFTFFDQPNSTYECRLDPVDPDALGTGWAACNSGSVTYTDLENGAHLFQVRATTPLGVVELPVELEWTVDLPDAIPPETSIDTTYAGSTTSTTASLLFSGTDNLTPAAQLTFECRLNSASELDWDACASGDPIPVPVGTNTLDVRAIDADENVDPTPASHTWTVDAGTINTSFGLGVEAVDLGVAGASATFENVTAAGITSVSIMTGSPALLAGYSDTGAIFFDVSTTASFMGNIEICLPYTGLDEPHLLHFDGSVWEDVTTSLDEDAGIVCGIVSSLSPFGIAAAPGLSPDTVIELAPADPSLETVAGFAQADFGFASPGRPSALFECSLDGADWTDCGVNYNFLASIGGHTLAVRAVDSVTGLFDLTPDEHTWTVEARPVATITSMPVDEDLSTADIENESRTATFEFTTNQPGLGSSFECRLIDDGPAPAFEPCASGITYQNLAFEEHTFEVQAVNADGHASLLPAAFEWRVADLTPPNTTITSGPSNPTSSTSASFQFSATEPAQFFCALDTASSAPCEPGFTFTNLDAGLHSFTVYAVDLSEDQNVELEPATHTWTVDLGAPSILLSSDTDGDPASFEFSATDNLSTTFAFECSLDGAAFVTCSSPQAYPGLGAGDHTFRVRTVDAAGNSTTQSHTWNVPDIIEPDTTITGIDVGSTIIHFTGSDNFNSTADLTYECKLDAGAFAPCASPAVYENAAVGAGPHTFHVRAVDVAGNKDASPDTYAWLVSDVWEPQTAITVSPSSPTASTSATFEFNGSDNVTAAIDLTFGCSLDGGTFAACTSATVYSGLTPGSHTFAVRASDAAGNTDGSPASYTWTILDTTAPTATITGDPGASTGATTATFEFTGSDDVTGSGALTFACKLDGAASFTPCSSGIAYTGLAVGPHTFEVRATDAALNTGAAASHTWTVLDTTAPVTTIATGPPASTPDTSAAFTFSATDDVSSGTGLSYECSIDGAPFTACSSPASYGPLSPGSHTFQVRATDTALNTGAPASYAWTILDTIDPDTTITGFPPASTGGTGALFTFTGSDDVTAPDGLSFECSLDGGNFSACGSPRSYGPLSIGGHTFAVRALDAAGNVDDTPATYGWTITDITAPETGITSGPDAATTSTSASFQFAGSDNHTAAGSLTFECSLDGSAFAACSSPATHSGLAVGSHTFRVRAIDAAGNSDGSPANRTWTVLDSTAPETTISAGPEASTSSGSATFTFAGTDDVTTSLTFRCSLDGGALTTCSSPKSYSGLLPGTHTFSVEAVDAANNADPSPATYSWTVTDVTAPETTITGQPAATTTNTSATFAFTGTDDGTASASLAFECALDGAAFSSCTSPLTYTGLAATSHTFEVKASDATGNTDASAASWTWTVQVPTDTTDPETSITAQPPATTTETSASFSFGGSDDFPGAPTLECNLDAGAWEPCTSPKTYSGLSVATHTFSVRATDAAGNVDESPATYSWTVQSPVNCGIEQTLTASGDAWLDQGSPTSNKGSDSILKVMSKSGNGNLRAALRFNLPTMPAGCAVQYATLRVYAKAGAAGRTLQIAQLGGSWTESAVTWGNQPATVGGTVTATSGTGYRDWNVASLVQEQYLGTNNGFLLRDAAENGDAEQQFHAREESTNRPLLVLKLWNGAAPPPSSSGDSIAPDTTITGSPLAASSSTSASFTFSGVDNVTPAGGLTFECKLDGTDTDPWQACSSAASYTGLAQGSHIFQVRAKDAAGNVDTQPAVYTWTVDTTAPETAISSGPAASTTSTTASFQFNSSEPGSTFQCALDGGSFAACSSPASYSGLSVATHSFQVRAIDAAGNVDGSAATYSWTITSGGGSGANCGTAQTLTSVADSWLNQSSTTSNNGSDGILKVMSKSGNGNLRALVRFNLPSIPAGCVLQSASLRLYTASASSSTRTLQALRANASWTEGGVTWANQPATTGAAVTTTSGTGYRSWTVTNMVGNMYSSGSNNGFLIRDATESQDAEQQFHAREKGDNPPQLVVTFAPSP